MKCSNCGFKLSEYYFLIAGSNLCLSCAAEVVKDCYRFKVLMKGGAKE